jgi:hypothetical protein
MNTTKEAFDALQKQLQTDDALAWSWHCNIAMAIFDTAQPAANTPAKHRFANEAAALTMSRLFEVDVTKLREWVGFQKGWELSATIAHAVAPVEGQVWRHRSGKDYTVLGVTSVPDDARAAKFPHSVFYRGPDGRKWARALTSWHESFTLVPQHAEVPECNGSHDAGQVAAGDAECTACAGEQSA